MSPQGVYPAADVCALGDEISSTYEGRHVTLYGDNIEHGSQVSYVTKGYGVWFEAAVGMPFATQTAALGNLLMTMDTEGIWCVDVKGENDGGDEAVAVGQALYINTTTGLVSKIRDNSTQLPFGYALGIVGSGSTERVAVKVHWDPISHTVLDVEKFYFGDGNDYTMQWNETFMAIVASAASKIIGEEFAIAVPALADGYGFKETNFNVSGAATGYTCGDSTWLNLEATYVALIGGGVVTPHTDGIYMTPAATITGAWVALGGKFTDQMDESDMAWYTMWNLNLTQTMDAIYEVNNPALLGYVATPATGAIGSIPFFSTGGAGMKYIMLYSNPA